MAILLTLQGPDVGRKYPLEGAATILGRQADATICLPAKAVSRLVEQLRQHPVKPSTGADRVGLYLIDVTIGDVTLVADQPEPGLTQCGSPMWSNDGKRIIYDATPGTQWNLTHLKAIELAQGHLMVTDLGLGNCPTFCPTGDRSRATTCRLRIASSRMLPEN